MGIYAAGEVIRRTRESLGMTQEELCEGICDVVTLSRIENGRNTPSRANFELLMERMGKSGKKYLPFIRSGDIRDHLLREELEQLIRIHAYEQVLYKLEELEEHLNMKDSVNSQYVLEMKTIAEVRIGRISDLESRKRLERALEYTLESVQKIIDKNGHMSEYEITIICNIAMTYMQEQQYDHSIEILKILEKYLDTVQSETLFRAKRLVLSNFGHVLGRSGKFEEALEIQLKAAELVRKEDNAGSLTGLLYRIAYDNEMLKAERNICIEKMLQAYVLAECIENDYMVKHISRHIIKQYGEEEWKIITNHLDNHHVKV